MKGEEGVHGCVQLSFLLASAPHVLFLIGSKLMFAMRVSVCVRAYVCAGVCE